MAAHQMANAPVAAGPGSSAKRPARLPALTPALLSVLLSGVMLLASAAPEARAQAALERNLPERPVQQPVSLNVDAQTFTQGDTTPLGVNLSGVHLIGQGQEVDASAPKGISGATESLAGSIPASAFQTALTPFLNEPLSIDLAGRVQAAIAKVYRDAGFPFVSVTLPPQEITSGVLQVRVIEFKSGTVSVTGVDAGEAEEISSDLRVERGQPIDARALDEDLSWLNRSPYRRAEGTFRPGEDAALSNLGVAVTASKPWQVFGGWSNSGSSDTGRDRYFLGGNARLPLPGGPWVSYQMTASDALWGDPSIAFPREGHYPDYISHAGRLTIPLFARQSLEIAPAMVATRDDPNAFFSIENTTYEMPVIYRTAISNFLPGHYWGDLYGGVELKRLERKTYFLGTPVADGAVDLFQLVLGWSRNFSDPYGRTALDLRVKANPDGVLHGNSAEAWRLFSNGRVNGVSYAYLAADVSRITPLPGRFSWISNLSGTLAGQPLPDTERISLGGRYAVRGYNYDDASVDSGAIWRNELRLPAFSPLASLISQDGWPEFLRGDSLSAFVFADAGYGVDHGTGKSATLGGLGAGFDYSIGTSLTANFIAGIALRDGGSTEAGDINLQASITARF
ncbi:ShlB/FhaC/HecB family hemolysin secretion/activation protein [Roseibium suaedae]|nr:ShlB/FhaC/HecB family hemolysin secretion/activation protein [Roseibium suaedae]